ncbi:hypothetical protein K438DRAFT_1768937 [Mycena galopus ATCC 62051]|nr:hypothetical protein K438DRAFT_1768937 [Mycena galopus ATCC 62051]
MNSVIIDDKNPLILYSAGWETGGTSVEFSGTTSWTPSQESTATFTFVGKFRPVNHDILLLTLCTGSAITIFGSIRATFAPQATMNFAVDNEFSGAYTAGSVITTIHHQPFWTSPALSEGVHTLVITQGEAMGPSTLGPIFLDYLIYNTLSPTAGPYFIDDSNARITYNPPWQKIQEDTSMEHTSHASTSAGDSFSLQFEGQSIQVYGTFSNGTNASMVIDGDAPVLFAPPIQTTSVTANSRIFDSGTLSDGTHTIVVTANDAQAVQVDYFLVTPPANASSSSLPSTSVFSSSPSSSASTTRKSVPTSVIAVSTLAGVIFLSLISTALFLFLRRRKRRQGADGSSTPTEVSPLTPFSNRASVEEFCRPIGRNEKHRNRNAVRTRVDEAPPEYYQ